MSKYKITQKQVTLAKRLREIREEKELTLTLAAAMIKIDPAVLSKIETGKRKINRKVLSALSKAYRIDSKELLKLYYSEYILHLLSLEENPKEFLIYTLKSLK